MVILFSRRVFIWQKERFEMGRVTVREATPEELKEYSGLIYAVKSRKKEQKSLKDSASGNLEQPVNKSESKQTIPKESGQATQMVYRFESGLVVDMRSFFTSGVMRVLNTEGKWGTLKVNFNISLTVFMDMMNLPTLSEQEIAEIDAKSGYSLKKEKLKEHLKITKIIARAKIDNIRYFMNKKLHRHGNPPYRVDLVDQFHGHCEDGYTTLSSYDSYEDALAAAKRITVKGIKQYGSVESWIGMGDAGLVYDSRGRLVWDGVREAEKGGLKWQ